MDPISQGALGAVAAGSLAKDKKTVRRALFVGWAGGMLADADIFIRSAEDPLLNIEYHRHFSHSLLFIPIGGLICAAVLWLVFRRREKFSSLLLWSTAGYATAGLLDACTSYGTRLLWPFLDVRVAWNIISIIDPIFTLTILILLGIAFKKRASRWAIVAGVFALAYLMLGVVQNGRASRLQSELIAERGHAGSADMETVKPSIGNLVLWRSVYLYNGKFHIDAVRVGFLGGRKVYPGVEVAALSADELESGVPEDSVLAGDIDRFAHFSADYLARHPDDEDVVGDLRYAMVPNSAYPLWGIRYDSAKSDQHAAFENFRDPDESMRDRLFEMLLGR
jgi:inner membrane protein